MPPLSSTLGLMYATGQGVPQDDVTDAEVIGKVKWAARTFWSKRAPK